MEALKRLEKQVVSGRLKKRDKILERVGRLKERFPKARPFVTITVSESPCQLQWIWDVPKFKAALARDGVSLMSTNHDGWTPTEFWETYMQLTTVENAFRVFKSHLLTRSFLPVWFAADNVYPSADHVPYLHRHFKPIHFQECRGKLPYFPIMRMPYYIFLGERAVIPHEAGSCSPGPETP